MQPNIIYRVSDNQPFYLWDDGYYRTVEIDDGHHHSKYSYNLLMNIFKGEFSINYREENKITDEKRKKENMPDVENIESIKILLDKVSNGEVSSRKAAQYIFEAADNYWIEATKSVRCRRLNEHIKFSEFKCLTNYKNFIELVASREEINIGKLQEQAKELLK